MSDDNTTTEPEQKILQYLEQEEEWVRFEQLESLFPQLDELELTKILRPMQIDCKIERGIAKINGENVSVYRIDKGYFRFLHTDTIH